MVAAIAMIDARRLELHSKLVHDGRRVTRSRKQFGTGMANTLQTHLQETANCPLTLSFFLFVAPQGVPSFLFLSFPLFGVCVSSSAFVAVSCPHFKDHLGPSEDGLIVFECVSSDLQITNLLMKDWVSGGLPSQAKILRRKQTR